MVLERLSLTGTPREVIPRLEAAFRAGRILAPLAEAEWLVAGLLGLGRTDVYVVQEPLTVDAAEYLEELAARRLAGEPLQYLIGVVDFCGHRLAVNPSVLIPRPETEVLVAHAIDRLKQLSRQHANGLQVLELGTGSGAIAISLAHAISACHLVAVELSWNALAVAKANITRHKLDERIRLVCADWTTSVRGSFHLVLANPPYVTTDEVDHVVPSCHQEPRMSLDGGPDGMRFYRYLWADGERLVMPGGWIGVECAEDQAEPLRQAASRLSWVRAATTFHDLTGRPRGLWIERV